MASTVHTRENSPNKTCKNPKSGAEIETSRVLQHNREQSRHPDRSPRSNGFTEMPSGCLASRRARLVLRRCGGSFLRSSPPCTRISKAQKWTSSSCCQHRPGGAALFASCHCALIAAMKIDARSTLWNAAFRSEQRSGQARRWKLARRQALRGGSIR